MHCPNCGSENRAGAKFCDECATPLPLACPACGAENRPGAKFCNECATPLTTQSQPPVQRSRFNVQGNQPPTPNPQPPSGGGSGRVLSQSHRDRSKATSQVARTARSDEPGPTPTTTSSAVGITHHATRNTHRLDAARNTLAEIYNWFTEGFDTKDLQEAKALLEELENKKSGKQRQKKRQR